ncbi:hypothetical protein CEP54_014686 [Fusarium duplospermum]|uniref:Uncharacterized protein n=1 Tax=Fusarium duplospermum TaxID=1325734 RepID=A0A428NUJ8_9HYPO|nr:hypothetical protein CEP54_014686 [Fusarium duplospermum]
MAEMPLSRPAPLQNTFSVPDTLSVSDAESVRAVAEGDHRWATPKPCWSVCSDNDELDTVSVVGPSWSLLDALDKARHKTSSSRLGSFAYRQPKGVALGPSTTILEALQKIRQHKAEKENSQSPVPSFA